MKINLALVLNATALKAYASMPCIQGIQALYRDE